MAEPGTITGKCRTRLREVRQDELVDPDPDVVTDAPGSRAEKSEFVPLIELNCTQFAESVRELGFMKKGRMNRIHNCV